MSNHDPIRQLGEMLQMMQNQLNSSQTAGRPTRAHSDINPFFSHQFQNQEPFMNTTTNQTSMFPNNFGRNDEESNFTHIFANTNQNAFQHFQINNQTIDRNENLQTCTQSSPTQNPSSIYPAMNNNIQYFLHNHNNSSSSDDEDVPQKFSIEHFLNKNSTELQQPHSSQPQASGNNFMNFNFSHHNSSSDGEELDFHSNHIHQPFTSSSDDERVGQSNRLGNRKNQMRNARKHEEDMRRRDMDRDFRRQRNRRENLDFGFGNYSMDMNFGGMKMGMGSRDFDFDFDMGGRKPRTERQVRFRMGGMPSRTMSNDMHHRGMHRMRREMDIDFDFGVKRSFNSVTTSSAIKKKILKLDVDTPGEILMPFFDV
ncbi:hypothetical protein TRFO_29673 [Tritrichomonas foetus]|uniref:Uncharacterized protein n=1 Tax=Tritrichomonas foetus TaxID=1144522 RepID=A0A1J4JV45_9EUKA|nr:hypothetical protein TRFO_29673 [Tritrichomonas foetus]|eukprot:OHT03017.1 hypothetical protein TRFO_29673 [Tritrichomonas foetus]